MRKNSGNLYGVCKYIGTYPGHVSNFLQELKTSYPTLPLCAWSIAEKALVEIASALYVGSKGRTRLKRVIRIEGSNLLNGTVVVFT